ncbi:DinB family protein [Parvibaculaceae bacterium PLY_AMNH_Bact1]|nr:DinB family protein [Parvibaculaceae bacterium PLY_AMNH_Bact1]
MSYKPTACEMARYNQWQNEKLLGVCDTLSLEDLEEDRGLFFGSILATLDHILHVDQTLLGMAKTGNIPAFDPTVRQSETYDGFKQSRGTLDDEIIDFFESTSESWFDDILSFDSEQLGRERHLPRWFYIAQMFNHQTHHRSQITSELHRMGIDYGNTDMPYNPLTPY